MITISDLNVSRENCLTELKDAEMMGHIMGGFFGFSLALGGSFGNSLATDLNGDGTIAPSEIFTPLPFTSGFSFDLGDLIDLFKH